MLVITATKSPIPSAGALATIIGSADRSDKPTNIHVVKNYFIYVFLRYFSLIVPFLSMKESMNFDESDDGLRSLSIHELYSIRAWKLLIDR